MPKNDKPHAPPQWSWWPPTAIAQLQRIVEDLLAMDATTQTKFDAVNAKIADLGTEFSSGLAGVTADITSIKAQLAAGGNPAQINAALDGVLTNLAKLQTTADGLAALDAETDPNATGDTNPPEV